MISRKKRHRFVHIWMVGGFPLPAYRARAARTPAPRIPNATSGRAAASGSSVAVAVEVARAEETRFEALDASAESGFSLTSVQIWFARPLASVEGGTRLVTCSKTRGKE